MASQALNSTIYNTINNYFEKYFRYNIFNKLSIISLKYSPNGFTLKQNKLKKKLINFENKIDFMKKVCLYSNWHQKIGRK